MFILKNLFTMVGINNIKIRLKEMLNAEVIVESALNEGTKVTIKIPKEDVFQWE